MCRCVPVYQPPNSITCHHGHLDLDKNDKYSTDPRKGQHMDQEGRGAHVVLGDECSQLALEGWWRAGLCYSSRKVVPLRDSRIVRNAVLCQWPNGGCLEASPWSSEISLVQLFSGRRAGLGACTMSISAQRETPRCTHDVAVQQLEKHLVRHWSWCLSTSSAQWRSFRSLLK